jgi:hypothetical protein
MKPILAEYVYKTALVNHAGVVECGVSTGRAPANSMATSVRAQKEAYLRRKGVKAPRPPTPEQASSPDPEENVHRDLSPRKRERRPSFAEKRKAALLSRARGGRPREVDVGMTAVLFAARLRISASHTKLDAQQETGAGETSAAGTSAAGTSAADTSAADTSAADTSAAERAPGERAPGERTWKQKRKDAYLRTHHAPPPPPAAAEVSIAAISFAAKLKSRSLAPPASSGGDKTFAQKRKVGLDYR